MIDADEVDGIGSMEIHLSGHDGSVQKGKRAKAIVASYPRNDNDVGLEDEGVLYPMGPGFKEIFGKSNLLLPVFNGSAEAVKGITLKEPRCGQCIVQKCSRKKRTK